MDFRKRPNYRNMTDHVNRQRVPRRRTSNSKMSRFDGTHNFLLLCYSNCGPIFYRLSVRLSVCLSICLSLSRIVSKAVSVFSDLFFVFQTLLQCTDEGRLMAGRV